MKPSTAENHTQQKVELICRKHATVAQHALQHQHLPGETMERKCRKQATVAQHALLHQHMTGGSKESYKMICQNGQCPSWHSNWALSEHKKDASLLCLSQLFSFVLICICHSL
jgi:hypothetical protein